MFGNSFVDSFPSIKEDISASDFIITEVKIDRVKLLAYYNSRTSSDTLSKILSKEDYAFIKDIFKNSKIDLAQYTPGELFVKLNSGYPKYKCGVISKADTSLMDEYIQHLGQLYHKEMYYLESDSFQLEKVTQMTASYNWNFLKKNISSLLDKYRNDKPGESLCKMANQYAAFDIDYKFESDGHLLDKKTNEYMVKDRNEDWVKKLPTLLEQHNCFIAVGLGHLYFNYGLIEQLRKLGYTVDPVTMK